MLVSMCEITLHHVQVTITLTLNVLRTLDVTNFVFDRTICREYWLRQGSLLPYLTF